MTLFHFGNCIALAYGPYFLTYKYSGLPEYGAFWKCVQVGGMYMLTQLCKMLLLATFFPTMDGPPENASLFIEFIKTTVDFGDLVGLSIVMGRIAGSGHIKVLVTGLGWAAADLLLTRALPLWVGARGLEFDWKYIQLSLDANISLVHHLCVALLLWLWWRSDLATTLRPLVALLLALGVYQPLLPQLMATFLEKTPSGISLLAANATPTVCTAFVALHVFITHNALTKSY
ncbi:BOS complex subunit TMEM147 [Oratosquilla oratoria]|uniref:BOS complex subunit TMEM147 n=1 Tax=Oratosquilla oratoria TaxID=337810 RepID=UPI003F7641E5